MGCGPPRVLKNASVRRPLSMEPSPFPCHPDRSEAEWRDLWFRSYPLPRLNNPITLTNRNNLIRLDPAKFLNLLRSWPLHLNQIHRLNLAQPESEAEDRSAT